MKMKTFANALPSHHTRANCANSEHTEWPKWYRSLPCFWWKLGKVSMTTRSMATEQQWQQQQHHHVTKTGGHINSGSGCFGEQWGFGLQTGGEPRRVLGYLSLPDAKCISINHWWWRLINELLSEDAVREKEIGEKERERVRGWEIGRQQLKDTIGD